MVLFVYSCIRQDWLGYAIVTNITKISLTYNYKHSVLTHHRDVAGFLQLCPGIQDKGVASIWNIASLMAERKEKIVGHVLACQTLAQKWHVSHLLVKATHMSKPKMDGVANIILV